MPNRLSPLRCVTPLLLLTFLAGCASVSPPSVVPPPKVPPLPSEAKQSPAPAWCLPSCSAGLTTLRESWLKLLTDQEPQDLPASAPIKP